MKKVLSIVLVSILSLSIISCGKKYEPNTAELGIQYISKTNKDIGGSNAGIIIKSVTKDGENITVKTESPIEDMTYAFNNFIAFTFVNEKGETFDKVSVKLDEDNQQGNFILTAKDINLDDIKYIQIIPYKNSEKYIEFKVE